MAIALPSSHAVPETHPAAPPRCPRCDYVLASIPEERCPECGLGYSLLAIERIEHFLGTQVVREYRAALAWSFAGLALATSSLILPLLLPAMVESIAVGALVAPPLAGLAVGVRAWVKGWTPPLWAWFSPMLGMLLLLTLAIPGMPVLAGAAASGVSGLSLLRTANIPDVLAPLDSEAGRRLGRWRSAAWAVLSLALLVQISQFARFL